MTDKYFIDIGLNLGPENKSAIWTIPVKMSESDMRLLLKMLRSLMSTEL